MTRPHLLRTALSCFALAALTGGACYLAGCSEKRSTPSAGPSGGLTLTSPGGTPVTFPSWLAVHPDLMGEALGEVDAAGVPAGWSVTVRLPKFETGASATGLARGLCDYDRRELHVGFRFKPCEDRPLLVALVHEAGHAKYGGCFEHDGEPGCPSKVTLVGGSGSTCEAKP